MFRCVVSSDWHFEGMDKVLNDSVQKQIAEIRKVYRYAFDNGIKHVVIPGDWAHIPRLREETMIEIIKLLLSYDDHINTYYVFGNHDIAHRNSTAFDLLKAVTESSMFKRFKIYASPKVETIDGVDIAFMPFPCTSVPHLKKPPLVFAHIETSGAIGDNGRALKHDDSKLIRVPGDYIVTGHIHLHQEQKKKRVLYCGSLYQTNFGESLPKGFLDLKARYKEGKLQVAYEYVNSHPNFILETKIIDSQNDWETLCADEHIRYRVLVAEGVVTPKDITKRFPNIVAIKGMSKSVRVQMENMQNGDITGVTNSNMPKINLKTGLIPYLRECGLTKEQRLRAKAFVDAGINTLSSVAE